MRRPVRPIAGRVVAVTGAATAHELARRARRIGYEDVIARRLER